MREHYLYRITNKDNRKVYVGITCDPKRRRYEHFKKKSRSRSIIRSAILKYGGASFEFEVLDAGSRSFVVDQEESLIKHYKALGVSYNIRDGGEDCGSGYKITYRSDDTPVYVLGFWFPNKRIAAKALNKGRTTIYRNLGKEVKTKASRGKVRPKRGSDKDLENRAKSMKGKNSEVDNGMFGRLGAKHPRARQVKIHGTIYDSISDAVRKISLTKSIIEKSLKKSKDGFEYINK
jgi:group I intron endonuclease